MTRAVWTRPDLRLALAAAALAVGAGFAIRFLAIEVHEIGQICDPGTGPWWCVPRQAAVQAFLIGRLGVGALGVAALLAGIGALVQGGRVAILIATALGGLGCVLYNADLAALGLVLALIAAARA